MISNLKHKHPAASFMSTSSMVTTAPTDHPSGSNLPSASNGFSIYNQNINFDEDYTSNYSFKNTKFMKTAPATPLVNSILDDRGAPLRYAGSSSVLVYPVSPSNGKDNNNETKHFNHNLSTSTISTSSPMRCHQQPKPFIHDIHNYSKPHSAADIAATHDEPQSDEEEDDEGDDEEAEPVEIPAQRVVAIDESHHQRKPVPSVAAAAVEKLAPDHHARRPMNAFLIFCKRHRAIVREKYPNLENRAITKILGDWWANMDVDEKSSFTDLAKQYKDAFFNANPTFQWYKLPAPPLRTLSAPRPGFADRLILPVISGHQCSGRAPSSPHSIRTELPRVGFFKLADEAQMGGLNCLMDKKGCSSARSSRSNRDSMDDYVDIESGNELQQALSETHSFLTKTMRSTNRTEPFCQYRVVANGGAKRKRTPNDDPKVPTKRWSYSSDSIVTSPQLDFERFVQMNLAMSESIQDSDPSTTDDYTQHMTSHEDQSDQLKKTSRACKGKRYLEFINTVKVSSVVKKPTKVATSAQRPMQTAPKVHYEVLDHMYAATAVPSMRAPRSRCTATSRPLDDTSAASAKQFDATDFDLDGKIKALVALNLEQHLSRKRVNKKKKKITTKRSAVATLMPLMVDANGGGSSAQTMRDAREKLKRSIVGSQKRKARKESITRRDIAHDAADAAQFVGCAPISPEVASSDLFILAEVASAVTN